MLNSIVKKTFILCLVAMCILQITSCGVKGPLFLETKDGPPTYDSVDPAKIPNAVPKNEKKSPYGNKSVYQIHGHTYKVLNNAYNYNKIGMASWYGTKFHGQLTSTHEPYDMFGMTAASTELPLPTYVKVTNLENGKQIVVKVNDRGPFEKNRLIDLSYVAAKKLGFAAKGTAHVKVTAVQPDDGRTVSFATKKVYYKGEKSHMYIQVGAFANSTNARRVGTRIADIVNTRKVRITAAKPIKSKPIYRVEIGPITTVAENDRLRKLLENRGYSIMPIIK